MLEEKVMEYTWGEDMGQFLLDHWEVEELLKGFLRYIATNTASHGVKSFKTMLGLSLEGRRCNLVAQAKGLVLSATRHKKPMRYVIESQADFFGGLRWILKLDDPKDRPMEEIVMRTSRKAREALAQLVVELGLGPVVSGILLDPAVIQIRGPEVVDVQRLLADFVGEDIVLIVMPLTDPGESQGSPTVEAE